jgi:hypothetical protein
MQRGVTDRAPDHALFSPSFEVTPQSHSSVRYQMSRGSAPSDRQLPSPYLLFLIRRLSFFIPGASSSQFTHITFSPCEPSGHSCSLKLVPVVPLPTPQLHLSDTGDFLRWPQLTLSTCYCTSCAIAVDY